MLLQEVKDKLRIIDNDEDANIQRIIDQGKAYLNDLIGGELNFEESLNVRALLLEYCRYEYNNAKDYFEENFKSEILRLQLKFASENQMPGGI